MHYDVKFGQSVVMTLTDVDAAAALGLALNEAAEHGFQTEGMRSHVVECDRSATEKPVEIDEYFALNAEDAMSHIRENSDIDTLKEDIQREKDHPRFKGGRIGVIDDAEEYLGELTS